MFENQQPAMPNQAAPAPAAPAGDMHTMPERFLETAMSGAGGGTPGGRGGKKTLVVIVVVIVVLGLLGGGAWYYFTRLANRTNQNTNTVSNTNGTPNVNGNRNVNGNVNGTLNTNVSSNANANGNVNAATNSNVNANANGNVNANANTNTNTRVSTTGTPLPMSADADKDGVTDVEEAVFGTKANAEDSDGDGFVDGIRTLSNGKIEGEIYNGYCPTKAGSVRLDGADCGVMRTYTNATYNYAVTLPKGWVSQATTSDDKVVIVTPDVATTEFFRIEVIDNPTQLTAKSHYLNLNPGVDGSKLKDAAVNGLDGVLSLDESVAYLVKGTKIYEISYNAANQNQVNLRTSFMVLYRNFRLVTPTSTNANTNASANANTNVNTNANSNTPPIFQ